MDMHPITLRFNSATEEGRYRAANERGLHLQSVIAVVAGLLLYLGYGLAEPLFGVAASKKLWLIRLFTLPVPLLALALLLTGGYSRKWRSWITAAAGHTAIFGVSLMMLYVSERYTMYYFSGIVLGVFWLYLCAGIGFFMALVSSLAVIAWVNVLLVTVMHPGPFAAYNYNFYLVAASALSGYAAYQLERRGRLLFRQARQLTRQRNRHRRAARLDTLTGLFNRRTLEERLNGILEAAVRDGTVGAIVFLDLDRFKPVNDVWGHAQGDAVLCAVAQRLRRAVRGSDVVGRLGGDEFLVILPVVNDPAAALAVAAKLADSVREPLALENLENNIPALELGASIGVCLFPTHGTTVKTLLLHADNAMYAAKRAGSRQPVLAQN